ncbi:hypothetical protein MLD38_003334 [Melastoma candidum]|uniref:Uncharacterized protein n=1 Tax=Melastoma candidum TaxID=119954 RepID=A0ACB9S2C9_9MYRT|nr:hypothetical protein MLD38_003334 [Melastoma candidum]
MAKPAAVLGVLFLLLSISLNARVIESRPLNISGQPKGWAADDGFTNRFSDGLLLGAMKQAGPSPGEGHKFADTVRAADEEPGLGEGHEFVDSRNTTVRVMDSGPSPGEGH